jgi:hypothetical protein
MMLDKMDQRETIKRKSDKTNQRKSESANQRIGGSWMMAWIGWDGYG